MLKKYPKLYDDAVFEILVKDVMQCKLGVIFQLYGRKGQAQQGIDLFANGEMFIVVQCKDYLSEKSEKEIVSIIEKEIEKSKQLEVSVSEFWFATALNRDVKIQNAINAMQVSVPIKVLFWEDIEEVLSYNVELERKYYPQYFASEKNYSGLLTLGFFSQIFAQYVDLMLYERIPPINYRRMIQNGIEWINNQETKEEILRYLNAIIKYLQGPLDLTLNFKRTDEYQWCLDVQSMILTIQSSLKREDCEIFILGKNLGKIDYQLNFTDTGYVSEELVDAVRLSVDKMFINDSAFVLKINNSLNRILKNEKEFSDYGVASRIFDAIFDRIT